MPARAAPTAAEINQTVALSERRVLAALQQVSIAATTTAAQLEAALAASESHISRVVQQALNASIGSSSGTFQSHARPYPLAHAAPVTPTLTGLEMPSRAADTLNCSLAASADPAVGSANTANELIIRDKYLHIANGLAESALCDELTVPMQSSSEDVALLRYLDVQSPWRGRPRLFCAVYATKALREQALFAATTWMPFCDGSLIATDAEDPELPSIIISGASKSGEPEEYTDLWRKNVKLYKHLMARHPDFDYYFVSGPDTYVLVGNLKAFLSGTSRLVNMHEQGKPLFLGRRWVRPWETLPFNSGGAGYALNRHALECLVAHLDDEECHAGDSTGEEDVFVARCLAAKCATQAEETRDAKGRELFHPFTPAHMLQYTVLDKNDWYYQYSLAHGLKMGFDCCSPASVSFHYVKLDQMRRLHAYAHQCRLVNPICDLSSAVDLTWPIFPLSLGVRQPRTSAAPAEAPASILSTLPHKMEDDPATGLRVPRFWWLGTSAAHKKLEEAVQPAEGKPSILLSIVSYRDFQCAETIKSALSRASHPERIIVSVVDQIAPGVDPGCAPFCDTTVARLADVRCRHIDRIHVYRMDARNATGPILARHVAARMYRGEAFVLQIDAHNEFVVGWDEDILAQWRATSNEYAVLSTYLTDLQGSIDSAGHSLRKTRAIMCNSDFKEGNGEPVQYMRHGAQPEEVAVIQGTPMLQPFWGAGFSFSRGHFVAQVPYDCCLPFVFHGEEISMGVRGWTHGYDFYAPSRSVMFHEYAQNSKRRQPVAQFWENRPGREALGERAMKRLLALSHISKDAARDTFDHMNASRYGIGNVRNVSEFFRLFQIDPGRRLAKPLCGHVRSGELHRAFTKHLRPDGRGIDYRQLTHFHLS